MSKSQSKKEKETKKDECLCLEESIMSCIKSGKVKMRSYWFFVAEKVGLWGASFLFFFVGTVLAGTAVYLVKESGTFKFLAMGNLGIKTFFLTLPLGALALFVFFVVLAAYFATKAAWICGKCSRFGMLSGFFLGLAIMLGIFWGMARSSASWDSFFEKDRLPENMAAYGQIQAFSVKEIVIKDKNGKTTVVIPEKSFWQNSGKNLAEGKFLRAVGSREEGSQDFFYASRIGCCDDY